MPYMNVVIWPCMCLEEYEFRDIIGDHSIPQNVGAKPRRLMDGADETDQE
jgi:hypothetical protein